jgi:hypothetical protein
MAPADEQDDEGEIMKLLAIALEGVDLASVLEDERFENVRRLVEAGAFGPLPGDASALDEVLTKASERRTLAGTNDEPERVDGAVGSLLEALDNETVVLAVARATGGAWYVLASPGTVPPGQTEGTEPAKLAELVTDLLAREAAAPADEDDDEALIRERFSGLGYIA